MFFSRLPTTTDSFAYHPAEPTSFTVTGTGTTCFSNELQPRCTVISSGWLALSITFWYTGSQCGSCTPSMRVIRSPLSKPAFAAGESAFTHEITAGVSRNTGESYWPLYNAGRQ